jgi:3-dehydroquinate dehydratase II
MSSDRPQTAAIRSHSHVWRISLIDGPNMPNLGARSKAIYGGIKSLAHLHEQVGGFAQTLGVELNTFSSNHEGEILEFIHRTASQVDGYLINPAGLTTVGEATRHALSDSEKPYVEVHFANIVRHFHSVAPDGGAYQSRFSYTASGVVFGLRQYSYHGALLALVLALDDEDFLGGGAR